MTTTIKLLSGLFTLYFVLQVGYLLLFSVAATVTKRKRFDAANTLRRIRIFIPGYKEDAVILATARAALQMDYPQERYEVVVIADSFAATTLRDLKCLPIRVVEVSFEKSSKGKALQKAIESTEHDPVDIAVILDADNHADPLFLHGVNNAFAQGFKAVQAHRTAKSRSTSFAFLDACTEEINNHIFRRGHVALGMSSALIGSGMAFDWQQFTSLLKDIGDTSGEDKELEFRLARNREKVAFLDGVYVYDEKVSRSEVFTKQRSRWLAMQVEYFEKYFVEAWIQLFRGNVSFFNKIVQMFLLPRVMLVAALSVWTLFSFVWVPGLVYFNLFLLAALAGALLLGIPAAWYGRELFTAFLQIPGAVVGILKSVLQIGAARKAFIHTPHGENPS